MKTDKVEIQITGLKKKYRLGAIGGRMLRQDIESWFAKKRGKENPNLRIGIDDTHFGEEFYALDGIDLTVYKGERLGIIGLNGAGKSTLLKILSQITAPTEGEIDLYGKVSSMLEVGTGFHGEMTGRENIYMNGSILGMTKDEIDSKMDDIIEFSEIGTFIDTPAKRYSSGMFVKLAFSVAAHLDSDIMIMDEVLAVGDMSFQQKCLEKMRQAADEEGRTVLYVSHNMNTIRNLCERVVVLKKGKIIYDGDVETGIAMYMEQSIEENEVDMDLSKKLHHSSKLDQGFSLEHLTLVDKVTPVYAPDENLKMLIKVNVTEPYKNVKIRLSLRTSTDVGLGTAWSECRDFTELGEQEAMHEFLLESIEKGVFYASVGAYYEDESGNTRLLDHVTRCFKIEVLGRPNWDTNAHGFMKFKMK